MSQLIDTHSAVKALVEEGVPERQAEAIVFFQARLFDERIATKDGLHTVRTELKNDIDTLRTELKNDIDTLKTELKNDIDTLRAELKNDIKDLSRELTIRMGGMLALAVTVLTALQTL